MRQRTASAQVARRNAPILARMRAIRAAHPFWGYRRTWAHLRYVEHLAINKKRVLRLMRQANLTVKPDRKLRACRTPTRSKPVATRPNQWWGIDMTKVCVNGFGWLYVVIVLDWYTKKVVGHHIGLQATSHHWLAALDMAINRQFPAGIREHNVHLMSDNGCQPTSMAFLKACGTLRIQQAFTSYNNPKGNADTERMMRTLKEWSSPFQLADVLETWIEDYNRSYLHSRLGYRSPEQYETEHAHRHQTPLAAT